MASTSERMLRLLSLLQSHRFWPGGELAERLEVSDRTLRRDIDRLRGLGYPVHASPGVAGGYQLQSGTVMPPLLLDDDEAVAIALGLSSAAALGTLRAEETSVRALSKVVQVMPPRLRRRVDALQSNIVPPASPPGPVVDATSLVVIAQAARDGERLRFGYRTRENTATNRHAEPHWLVPLSGRWYLVAWDLDRGDWRTFRVDRLTEPVTAGARFRHRDLPDGQDPPSFIRASLGSAAREHRIEVHVSAPADAVRRVVGRWGSVEALEDGSARLIMRADGFQWPAAMLAEVGSPFTVVEPEELRAYLRKTAELFRTESDRNPLEFGGRRPKELPMSEHADLLESLARHRGFLRQTVRDLTDEQARQRTTVSVLHLGGLIKHVASNEEGWVDFILRGPKAMEMTPELMAAWETEHTMLEDETLEGLLSRYDAVAEKTTEVVKSLPDLDASHPLPEAPWFEPGAHWSARRVLLHIIAETSQHAGHADIIRESLDGAKTMG